MTKKQKTITFTIVDVFRLHPEFVKLFKDKGGNITGVTSDTSEVFLRKKYDITDWPKGESIVERG